MNIDGAWPLAWAIQLGYPAKSRTEPHMPHLDSLGYSKAGMLTRVPTLTSAEYLDCTGLSSGTNGTSGTSVEQGTFCAITSLTGRTVISNYSGKGQYLHGFCWFVISKIIVVNLNMGDC